MHKLLLIVFGLAAAFVALAHADNIPCCDGDPACQDFVCQPCSDPKECPECFPYPNGQEPDYHEPCCIQLSQVVALTSASVQAAVLGYAAAQAATQAATRVEVASVAAASVAAYVSISQSLSLSINTGRCCNITQDVLTTASAYASSAAKSAAYANAAAVATASAASAAQAAASAASSFYSEAQSLIQSTCCGFNLEVYSAVLTAGRYAVSVQGAVDAVVAVKAAASDAAVAIATAASVSQSTTTAFASVGTDNCCTGNFTASLAYKTADACLLVCKKAQDVHGLVSNAFQYFGSWAKDWTDLKGEITLIDDVKASECADVRLSCCDCPPEQQNCCDDSIYTVGLASYAISDVFQSANVVVEQFADALAYAETKAAVFASAIASANTAAKAASAAAVSLRITVSNCCSITVTIDTKALSNAKAVGTAISDAQSIAQAYAYSYATSQGVANAVASASASASSAVIAYYNGCCGKDCCDLILYLTFGGNRLGCCDVAKRVVQAFSNEYLNLVSTATQNEASEARSVSKATSGSNASDCVQLIRRVSTRSAFILNCCCCTTKNAAASTVRAGYASTSRLNNLLW